jgi:transketolase
MQSIKKLQIISAECRKDVTNMIYHAKSGHIGGSLSSIDILVALYFETMNIDPLNLNLAERDRFLLSKGHSVEAYYVVLAKRGYLTKDELSTYGCFNSKFSGHPNIKIPGIEMSTGSLGHGLAVANGMAIAAKKDKSSHKVYVLMGDGELAEGSVWEAAMAAGNYGLDNLVGIIDRNRLQISGGTEEVMKLENLMEKWKAFGWHTREIDGHDMSQLVETFSNCPLTRGMPTMIIANTTKGKGISFMENQAKWHHGTLDEEQYQQAMKELDAHLKEVTAQ